MLNLALSPSLLLRMMTGRLVLFSVCLAVATLCGAVLAQPQRSVEKRAYTSSCGKVDVVFLVDSSGSIGADNFNKTLVFLQSVVRYVSPFGPNGIQIGVDVFGSSFYSEIGLDDYSSSYYLRRAIGSITYRDGSTQTALALSSMTNRSFTYSAGHRPGVPKMAVIVTDGRADSYTRAVAAANSTKRAGIYLLAVGVGSSVDYSELNAFASEPNSKNVFNATSHGYLSYSLASRLRSRLCTVCHGMLDVVFLIDTSTSLTERLFNDTLAMIVRVVSYSPTVIGPNDVLVGVDTFDSVFREQLVLGQHTSSSSLARAVQGIRYQNGGDTNTALGIVGMKDVSFSPQTGHRARATKVAVVVTDGKSRSSSDTSTAARNLRYSGFVMVAVGIGSSLRTSELNAIATNSSYVYTGSLHYTSASLRTLLNNIRNNC